MLFFVLFLDTAFDRNREPFSCILPTSNAVSAWHRSFSAAGRRPFKYICNRRPPERKPGRGASKQESSNQLVTDPSYSVDLEGFGRYKQSTTQSAKEYKKIHQPLAPRQWQSHTHLHPVFDCGPGVVGGMCSYRAVVILSPTCPV